MRFPPTAIDMARSVSASNMLDTCVATSAGSFIEDTEGGGTYVDPATISFACRTWPLDAKQMATLVAEQLREPGLEGLAYPVNIEMPITSMLTITRAESGDVHRYEIKGLIPDPMYMMHRRAIIKRLPPAVEGS